MFNPATTKKIAVILFGLFLFVMFLVYANVFRNFHDPRSVSRYYFECIKNGEAFLTFPITLKSFFSEDITKTLYKKFNMQEISKIDFAVKEINNTNAIVEALISYRDKTTRNAFVKLQKDTGQWRIKEMELLQLVQ